MQLLGIGYIDGTVEYDSVNKEYVRFQLPATETIKVVDMLRNAEILNLERAYRHLQHTRLGIREFIDGVEPSPPYITARMERLGNGSMGKDSITFNAVKEGAMFKPYHVEQGKLTIAQIAEVLGITAKLKGMLV